jgi:crossover junction endodeoxyribonuclease RuvC
MLQRTLSIPDADMPEKLDATDGLAAAVCHFYQSSSPLAGAKTYGGWKSFLSANPDRIGGNSKKS